ncbi:unnamed protein product [Natator depressus]
MGGGLSPESQYCKSQPAKVLVEQVFSLWGIPGKVESDQGSHYAGQFFKDCLKMMGVWQRLHIPYRPQSSGMVERTSRIIKVMLRKLVEADGCSCDSRMPLIFMALRATPAVSTDKTPFEVMAGRNMRLPEHLIWHISGTQLEGIKMDTYLQNLQEHLNQVHLQVAAKLGKSRLKAKAYFDKKQRENTWEVGDQMMLLSYKAPEHGLCN